MRLALGAFFELTQAVIDHSLERLESDHLCIDFVELRFELRPREPTYVLRTGVCESAPRNSLKEITETNVCQVFRRRISETPSPTPDEVKDSDIEEVLRRRVGKPSWIPPLEFAEAPLDSSASSPSDEIIRWRIAFRNDAPNQIDDTKSEEIRTDANEIVRGRINRINQIIQDGDPPDGAFDPIKTLHNLS